jgi:hypothetical protein
MKAFLKVAGLAAAITGVAFACAAQTAPGAPASDSIEHAGPLSPTGAPRDTPPAQLPALTAAQKAAIFSYVTLDKAKIKPPPQFATSIGAPVPPTVELYPLPEGALAEAPAARPYKYTLAADQVVLVDPNTMRVIDVIKP